MHQTHHTEYTNHGLSYPGRTCALALINIIVYIDHTLNWQTVAIKKYTFYSMLAVLGQ